jgi:hypothetical protein
VHSGPTKRAKTLLALLRLTMSQPMIWGTWPLVADLNNESVGAGAVLPEDPLGCQTSTGDGEEGSKRRAACDECRMYHITE